MLNLKFIRNNPDLVRKAIEVKNEKADLKKVLSLDERKRAIQFEYDNLKAEQNRVSREIPQLKKKGEDLGNLIRDMGKISKRIKNLQQELTEVSSDLEKELLSIPNIPQAGVPIGKDESDNKFVREWGEKKEFNFSVKDHLQIAEQNELLDFKRTPKISGSGFISYTGKGSALERSLINFMLDYHIQKNGYYELSLPVLVNRSAMQGTGQIPKLEEDMYLIEQDDLFLIPTAEVSITNFHTGEILSHNQLPLKYVSYSSCFRREAGSYGKDTKGLQRLHQFNKVEMVRLVHPQNSYQELEKMVEDAEAILQQLGLHYRVMELSTADLSFASAKTYDLEVWAPGAEKYLEVSSISNFEGFQARRADLRFRDADEKVKFLHTLNGSGLATPRTMIAILETYQQEDGSFRVPKCLRSYLNQKVI